MLIRELETNGGVIVRAMQARQAEADKVRAASTPGLHLSTIVNDLVDTMFPKNYPEIDPVQRFTLYELGDVIEELIADECRRRTPDWVKPLPRQHDGIWCSPDGDSPGARTLDEVKSTRVSCGQVVRQPSGIVEGLETHHKLLKHVMQLKCYMHAWGYERGRLHELFLNGAWKPPFPKPRTFILRPESPFELRRTWEQVTDHASDRGWL